MATYDDALSLGAARERYFAASGFDASSYEAAFVPLVAGPIRLWLPNTAARVRAVRLHDLHHVLTGYDTSWTGEGEIGAWELGSGCARHTAAWVLNLYAFVIGCAIAPRATFRAFVRGRRTRNLYREEYRDDLLARSVGEQRRALGLDRAPGPARPVDALAFGACCLAGEALAVATLAPAIALVVGFTAWLARG